MLEFLNKEADQMRKAREESEKSMRQKMDDMRSSRKTVARR